MSFMLVVLLALAQSDSQPSSVGLKLVTRQTSNGGMPSEQTEYLQGDRRRMEYRNLTGGPKKPDGTIQINYGPHLASIQRCDLGQAFELNLDERQYVAVTYPPAPLTPEQRRARGLATGLQYFSDKPTIRVEITTVDTHERKAFFGHTARHIITTQRGIPLEGSQAQPSQTVSDGWYIDFEKRLSCDRVFPRHGYTFVAAGNKPIERRTFVTEGNRETGFPIQLITHSRSSVVLPDGTNKQLDSTFEMVVTEFEQKPLDPELFEIPAGFHQVASLHRNPPSALSTWAALKQWFQRFF